MMAYVFEADQAFFETFILELDYSHFHITEDRAHAYFTDISHHELSFSVYSFVLGILLNIYAVGFGMMLFLIILCKKKGRKTA